MTRLARAALLILAAAACHPGEPTDVAELDIVATVHDDTTNFQAITTYAMPDSVVAFDPESSGNQWDHSFDAQILVKVATELEARGYVRDSNPSVLNPPDVVVLASGLVNTVTELYATYPWWGYWGWYGWGWYPYYGPGWGVAYPWYPTVGAVQYDQGTVLIEMLDTRSPNLTTQQLRAVWSAVLNGVAGGSSLDVAQRLDRGITRAFEQSPYLSHN